MNNSHSTPSADGRIRRGARNRKQIVDALARLITAGNPKPTAQQVAAEAKVGERTLFRHFSDMYELRKEIQIHANELFKRINYRIDVSGNCDDRINKITQARSQVFQVMAPFIRAGLLHSYEPDYTNLERLPHDFHFFVNRLVEDTKTWFAPEIQQQGEEIVLILDMVLCFENWDRLQRLQQKTTSEAEQLIINALRRILLD